MANCKSCGAPLSSETPTCPYCGTRNVVDLDLISSSTESVPQEDRSCPNCNIGLKTVNVGQNKPFYIEVCNECGGLFFDNNELVALLEHKVSFVNSIDYGKLNRISSQGLENSVGNQFYKKCPICGDLMNREKFGEKSGVIVNHCNHHGIWLEAGEFTRLAEWKKAGGEILDSKRKYQREQEKLREQRLNEQLSKGSGIYSQEWNSSSYKRYDAMDMLLDFIGNLFKR